MKKIDEDEMKKTLNSHYQEAEELLKDSTKTEDFLGKVEKKLDQMANSINGVDKTEETLQRLEQKLESIPEIGKSLTVIPIFISLVRSYIRKEYKDVPIGSITAIVGSLLYFFSPIDLVSDVIPILGYVDDVFVVDACFQLVKSDVSEYVKWREENNRVLKKEI